mmetsp:Transcript_10255/g.16524  ORF Transcript_10255/g.16524 Transcript_10255/m.16524 type:complete len:214 (+) Transcript_10255:56-697(+)
MGWAVGTRGVDGKTRDRVRISRSGILPQGIRHPTPLRHHRRGIGRTSLHPDRGARIRTRPALPRPRRPPRAGRRHSRQSPQGMEAHRAAIQLLLPRRGRRGPRTTASAAARSVVRIRMGRMAAVLVEERGGGVEGVRRVQSRRRAYHLSHHSDYFGTWKFGRGDVGMGGEGWAVAVSTGDSATFGCSLEHGPGGFREHLFVYREGREWSSLLR